MINLYKSSYIFEKYEIFINLLKLVRFFGSDLPLEKLNIWAAWLQIHTSFPSLKDLILSMQCTTIFISGSVAAMSWVLVLPFPGTFIRKESKIKFTVGIEIFQRIKPKIQALHALVNLLWSKSQSYMKIAIKLVKIRGTFRI